MVIGCSLMLTMEDCRRQAFATGSNRGSACQNPASSSRVLRKGLTYPAPRGRVRLMNPERHHQASFMSIQIIHATAGRGLRPHSANLRANIRTFMTSVHTVLACSVDARSISVKEVYSEMGIASIFHRVFRRSDSETSRVPCCRVLPWRQISSVYQAAGQENFGAKPAHLPVAETD